MTDETMQTSFLKPVKEFWHAILLIVPITFRWLWFLIKSRKLPGEKKAEMFWDMGAENMDRYAHNEGLKMFEGPRNEKLKQYLRRSDSVLDYGCGNGTITIMAAGRVQAILGIDFAAGMVSAAERKAADAKRGNARFLKATIFDERLEKGSYDVVMAWGIIHLLDDRDRVMERICELLKPGGLMIGASECLGERKTAITRLLAFLMRIGIFPIGLKFMTVAELEGSVTASGLRIVEKQILADNPVSCFIAAKKAEH
jgi:ubiquinone/menaquinone biosynthesis C-methylase UbiE